MKYFRCIIPLIIFLVSSSHLLSDTVILKNGKKIVASWVKEDNDKIIMKTTSGVITMNKNMIEKIIKDDKASTQTPKEIGQAETNDTKNINDEIIVRYESDDLANVTIRSKFDCWILSDLCSEWPESYESWKQSINNDFRYYFVPPTIYTKMSKHLAIDLNILLTQDNKIKNISFGLDKDDVDKQPGLSLAIQNALKKIKFERPACENLPKNNITIEANFQYLINQDYK